MKNGELKIISLKVDGLRKLKAVEMDFSESGLTEIRGRNGQGKTTVGIDTIQWLIEGNKHLNKDIINHDKKKAKAELRVGPYEIKRATTGKSNQLEVKNVETGEIKQNEVQNFLNTLVNELTFNPMPFLEKTPAEQLKFVMKLFDIDFTELDARLATLEADRLSIGREVKRFGDLDDDMPEKVERVDVQKLIDKKDKIDSANRKKEKEYQDRVWKAREEVRSHNDEQDKRRRVIDEYEKEIQDNKNRINEIKDEIKRLEVKLARETKGLKETISELSKLAKPEDEISGIDVPEPKYESTDELTDEIRHANATNVKADAYQSWLAKKEEKEEKENEYSTLSEEIKEIRKAKVKMLKEIDTGVSGLEITEEGLYYKGEYSQNWSDAEGIRLATELCLAQMPKLKAIFLDRGETFDFESRESLNKWAKKHGVQVIITIVDSVPDNLPDDDNVFYIEDGSILKKGAKK